MKLSRQLHSLSEANRQVLFFLLLLYIHNSVAEKNNNEEKSNPIERAAKVAREISPWTPENVWELLGLVITVGLFVLATMRDRANRRPPIVQAPPPQAEKIKAPVPSLSEYKLVKRIVIDLDKVINDGNAAIQDSKVVQQKYSTDEGKVNAVIKWLEQQFRECQRVIAVIKNDTDTKQYEQLQSSILHEITALKSILVNIRDSEKKQQQEKYKEKQIKYFIQTKEKTDKSFANFVAQAEKLIARGSGSDSLQELCDLSELTYWILNNKYAMLMEKQEEEKKHLDESLQLMRDFKNTKTNLVSELYFAPRELPEHAQYVERLTKETEDILRKVESVLLDRTSLNNIENTKKKIEVTMRFFEDQIDKLREYLQRKFKTYSLDEIDSGINSYLYILFQWMVVEERETSTINNDFSRKIKYFFAHVLNRPVRDAISKIEPAQWTEPTNNPLAPIPQEAPEILSLEIMSAKVIPPAGTAVILEVNGEISHFCQKILTIMSRWKNSLAVFSTFEKLISDSKSADATANPVLLAHRSALVLDIIKIFEILLKINEIDKSDDKLVRQIFHYNSFNKLRNTLAHSNFLQAGSDFDLALITCARQIQKSEIRIQTYLQNQNNVRLTESVFVDLSSITQELEHTISAADFTLRSVREFLSLILNNITIFKTLAIAENVDIQFLGKTAVSTCVAVAFEFYALLVDHSKPRNLYLINDVYEILRLYRNAVYHDKESLEESTGAAVEALERLCVELGEHLDFQARLSVPELPRPVDKKTYGLNSSF